MNDMKPIIICIHQSFLRNEYLFVFRAKDETFRWNEFCNKNPKAEHRPQQKQKTTNAEPQTPNEQLVSKVQYLPAGRQEFNSFKWFFVNATAV